ncbi:Exonuclease V gamma subunit [Pseudomonas syringae pv. actinidiae]|uniref:Exonuclease V gamma subunit n=1 Tax=Pseudomonas syringae pv. actinidiae TaxID=103796 RepID=A0AAN4QCF4_PSESF|nr:Exonuclease V gamma subunit [Pseudomonas syringae pv. actinidiae]
MLTQVTGQTLITLAGTLQHAIGHWAWCLLGAFSVTSQYSGTFYLRNGEVRRLLCLLCQLRTSNVILVVQADTSQNSNSNRRCYSQTTQRTPRTACGLERADFIGNCGRYCGRNVQMRDQQFFVHGCTSNLITRPGGTSVGIVNGI